MTVYVDELRVWPTKIRCFKGGAAHLTADTLDELHAFAARLGLKRAWFQDKGLVPHYDLTPGKHGLALVSGAVFVPAREQAEKRIAARRAAPPGGERLAAIEREDREAAARREAVRPIRRAR